MVLVYGNNSGADQLDVIVFSCLLALQFPYQRFQDTTKSIIEPRCEKTGLRPGPTQTGLYSHRTWLDN